MDSKLTLLNYNSKNFPNIDLKNIEENMIFCDLPIFQNTNFPLELLALDEQLDKKINVIYSHTNNKRLLHRLTHRLKNINLFSNPYTAMIQHFHDYIARDEKDHVTFDLEQLSTQILRGHSIENKYKNDFRFFSQKQVAWNPHSQKVLCLNRKPRPHRPIVLSGLLSYGLSGTFSCRIDDAIVKKDFENFENYATYHSIGNWFANLQKQRDNVMDPYANKLSFDEMYSDSKLEVVNESQFFDHFFTPTEKVLRPIMKGVPFVLCAPAGSLKMLKTLGFKTFDPIIDESYDAELNPFQRIVSCVSSAFKFVRKKLSPEEINQIVSNVKHNRSLISNIPDLVEKCLTNYKIQESFPEKIDAVDCITITCSATDKSSFITCNGHTKQISPSLYRQVFNFSIQDTNYLESKNCYIRSVTMNGLDITHHVSTHTKWQRNIIPELMEQFRKKISQTPNIYSEQYLHDVYN